MALSRHQQNAKYATRRATQPSQRRTPAWPGKCTASPRRQRGLALLMAMLLVVIATTVAVNIMHEEKFTIRKNAHIQSQDRATLYGAALEDYARLLLREDLEENKYDGPGDFWAEAIEPRQIPGGFIDGYIEDEQARFNLNSLLASEEALTRFERLCDNLELDDEFIQALLDWLDQDSDITYPGGMEENYENYRVANREMSDISELLLVHNVTAEIYEKLRPHVTALPAATTINVNTMSETIYLSLAPDLDASNFTSEREAELFEDIDDFVTRLQIPVDTGGLSVDSSYFRVQGVVTQGNSTYPVSTLVFRDSQEGDTLIVNRTLGSI